jgi:hypothetical protein
LAPLGPADGPADGPETDLAAAGGENLISSALLDGLAREHGTDKSSAYHGYAEQYGRILEPLRRGSRPKAVVEVGVCRKWEGNRHICPSLAMWADWFALAGGPDMVVNVIGLDKLEFGIDDGRILTLVCDQGDAGHLAAARHALKKGFGGRGGVDLIVDDGSHEARHQQGTMKALWPVLRVGGAYVIEDLNYNPEHEERVRRVRGCVETWQAGMKPAWLVDLRREMKTVDKIEWVDSKVAGKRSAVVLWKARDL